MGATTRKRRVLAFGDTHFPFCKSDALGRAMGLIESCRPSLIIQLGDLYDQYSDSKYPRSLNLLTPAQEEKLGREQAEEFWHRVRRAAGRQCKLVQLKGNHDDRKVKRALEGQPVNEHIIASHVNRLMTFDGVETVYDSKQEFVYDGVVYMHGYAKFGEHAKFNGRSTVTGHTHRGGVIFDQNIDGPFWELNAGWLGDLGAGVFSYYNQRKVTKTTLGVGYVDELGPRFIPFG